MSRHDPGQQYVLCAIAIAASLCTVSLPPCAGQISDRYVSLDQATGDLRVSFQSGGPNHVLPQVSVSVEYRDQVYSYRYEVSNEPAAQQPITQWHAIIDPEVKIIALDTPSTWGHDAVRPTATDPEASTYVWPPGLHLRWGPKAGGIIPPGSQQGPFSLSSEGRPGFVRAFFSSTVIHKADDPVYQVPPEVLRGELHHINNIELSGVSRMVVGPAFAPLLKPAEIATKLVAQIQQLIGIRQLSQTSGFVQDVLKFLNRWAAGETPSKDELRRQPPATSAEKDVALVVDSSFTSSK